MKLSTDYLESLLKSCPSGDESTHTSFVLANLAERFSSYGQQFKYDASKTVLWCKPDFLRIVLRCVLHRGYRNLRVGMHGSSDYGAMAKDPFVFDPNYNTRTGHAHARLVALWGTVLTSDRRTTCLRTST